MRLAFEASCPKDESEPEANEDRVAFAPDGSRLALSDGASDSYDSKGWASLLSERFVREPAFDARWLDAAVLRYAEARDFEELSWSKRLAFDRGSFATLLGVEHNADRAEVEALAIGDTVALLADGERFVGAWPFSDPELFGRRPTLLSTSRAHNAFVEELGFYARSVGTFGLGALSQPRVLCMTDALAKWALEGVRDGAPAIAELLGLATPGDLRALVARERAAGRMDVDDSTLAVLAFDQPEESGGLSDA